MDVDDEVAQENVEGQLHAVVEHAVLVLQLEADLLQGLVQRARRCAVASRRGPVARGGAGELVDQRRRVDKQLAGLALAHDALLELTRAHLCDAQKTRQRTRTEHAPPHTRE